MGGAAQAMATGGQAHSHRPVSAMPTPSNHHSSNNHHHHSNQQHSNQHSNQSNTGDVFASAAGMNPAYSERRASAHPTMSTASSNSNSSITSQISTLTSTVLKVTVRPSVSNSDSKPEIHSFWLAHLVNPNDDQRALWPLQGSAHGSIDLASESSRGVVQKQLELDNRRKWLQLGKEPNRIAGRE